MSVEFIELYVDRAIQSSLLSQSCVDPGRGGTNVMSEWVYLPTGAQNAPASPAAGPDDAAAV